MTVQLPRINSAACPQCGCDSLIDHGGGLAGCSFCDALVKLVPVEASTLPRREDDSVRDDGATSKVLAVDKSKSEELIRSLSPHYESDARLWTHRDSTEERCAAGSTGNTVHPNMGQGYMRSGIVLCSDNKLLAYACCSLLAIAKNVDAQHTDLFLIVVDAADEELAKVSHFFAQHRLVVGIIRHDQAIYFSQS